MSFALYDVQSCKFGLKSDGNFHCLLIHVVKLPKDLITTSMRLVIPLHVIQGSHGIEKPGKSRGFVIVFFPGLEIGNFLENREISCKVGKKINNSGTVQCTRTANHLF